MATFQTDQLVWAKTGDRNEEPGTVLKTGCQISSENNDSSLDPSNDKEEYEGVEVRLHVSGYKVVLHSSQLRPLDDDSGSGKTERPRRSTRSTRMSAAADDDESSGGCVVVDTQSKTNRLLVTPSPQTVSSNQKNKDGNSSISESDENMSDKEEERKPAAKRKAKSGDVVETPKKSKAKAAKAAKGKKLRRGVSTVSTEENEHTSSPYFGKKKRSAEAISSSETAAKPAKKQKTGKSKSSRKPKGKRSLVEKDEEEEEPEEIPSANESESEREPKVTKKKKAPTKKQKKTEEATPVKKSTKEKASKKKAPVVLIEHEDSSDNSEVNLDDDDDDDEFDRPFTVEYSTTGRATCRSCDELIQKGVIRVSHVPLFRGKPGYRIYRHMDCAVFPEEVNTAKDIGGWRKLKKNDLAALEERVAESKRLLEEENEALEPDELVQTAFQGEIRETPKGLTGVNLLPFQLEGISWMYNQEYNVEEIRGGILSDEMGMGKTIQTIVTMLDNRPMLQHSKPGAKHPPSSPDVDLRKREEGLWAKANIEWKHEMEMNNVPKKMWSKKGTHRAGTLVVCPLIALSQWKAEIEKFTEPNTFSIGVYHGTDRVSEMPLEMMKKYDVVLTTYQVLEQDFRKMVSPNKVTCPNCKAKFKIDKLRIHLKYFCGEGAQRTEAQARQRRGNERAQNDRQSGNGRGKKGGSKKKPTMKNTFEKKGSKTKKTLRVKGTEEFDSDSDLSIDGNVITAPSKTRPSRSAAKTASKKMAASMKEWSMNDTKDAKNDDESSFNSGSEDSVSDVDANSTDSEEMMLSDLPKAKGKPRKKVKATKSADDSALERAIMKQEKAMKNAKSSKKGGMKKGKKSFGKKGKGKKFDDSDDSDDESLPEDPSDPLDGIDLDALMEEAMAGSKTSPLHLLSWWRVVLDEAHFIKSRSSQTAAAAFALTSIHRWCLSGTPLQNRVGELYSLIRFLRIDPMAHYFCRQKGCGCKSIHYRMQHGKCLDCGHRSFSHFAHFNKHVLTPIQRDGYSGDGRRAMFTLKNEVLDKCLLRRTKESRAADMELPPRIVTIRSVRLHPVEEDFYQSLYMETKASFDDYVQAGTLLNNYAHIFDLLTKMRQATNHPYMVIYTKKNASKYLGQKAAAVANGSVDCDMCHEPPTDRVLSSCCGAGFCRSCVIEYLGGAGGANTPCPSCRSPFTIDLNQAASDDVVDEGTLTLTQNENPDKNKMGMPSLKEMSHVASGSILRRVNLAEFATSTKIEVLIQELIEMRQKRPGSKALVFSQFVNMLDLVRWRLHSDPCLADLGLGVRILHGGMDAKSRDAALKDFREDNNCRVLLMSLKAAGVALNLTVASECFLLDLWWNPAAEMQAIDRTHRLGQYRPIRAVRFVAEGTVEERVLQLQDKKRLVFDGTVGRDAGSLKMLTVDDMKSLFA